MKKMLLAAFIITLAAPVFASDADKEQEYQELCKTYAQEDGVEAEEMNDYIKDCVKELKENAAS